MYVGSPGHCRTGGIHCAPRPVDKRWRGFHTRVQHIITILIHTDTKVPPPDSTSEGIISGRLANISRLASLTDNGQCWIRPRPNHACGQQMRPSHRAGSLDARRQRSRKAAGLRIRRGIRQELCQCRKSLLRCRPPASKTASQRSITKQSQKHKLRGSTDTEDTWWGTLLRSREEEEISQIGQGKRRQQVCDIVSDISRLGFEGVEFSRSRTRTPRASFSRPYRQDALAFEARELKQRSRWPLKKKQEKPPRDYPEPAVSLARNETPPYHTGPVRFFSHTDQACGPKDSHMGWDPPEFPRDWRGLNNPGRFSTQPQARREGTDRRAVPRASLPSEGFWWSCLMLAASCESCGPDA